MTAFLLRRLSLALLVLALLSCGTYCFFAWQSPSGFVAGEGISANPHPPSPLEQYWAWVKGLWGGQTLDGILHRPTFTRNFTSEGPMLLDSLGHTLALLGYVLVLILLAAVAIALVAAARRGSLLDLVLRALSYLAWAVPAFLLALLVQGIVNRVGGSRGIGPFPLAGWPGQCPAAFGLNRGFLSPCPSAGTGAAYAWNVIRYTTLPAFTLAAGFVGVHARYLRTALLDALDQPYVTTARAKGLTERRVLLRYALRNSLVTFAGALLADVGAIFGAAMAVDYVFELNGLGSVFVSAFPVDMGSVNVNAIEPVILLTAILVLASSLLADLFVRWLDPRIRDRT